MVCAAPLPWDPTQPGASAPEWVEVAPAVPGTRGACPSHSSSNDRKRSRVGGRRGQPCEARTPAVAPCLRHGSRTRTRLGSHQGSPRARCGPARSWAEPSVQKETARASLVAQWLRIRLPMQGDTGSSPGLGRSHMLRTNWAREPQLLSLRVWSLCSTTGEAAMVRGPRTAMKSGPCLPQLEKALAQKRRPNTAKNNK